MSAAINVQVFLVSETCCNCGIPFAMPDYLQRQCKENKKNFYCPNGHGQHYTTSEIDKLRADVARAKQDGEWWKNRAEVSAKEVITHKGQITKLKNRISKGVCPCCQRTFVNLGRHMHTKHPDFGEAKP